MSRLEATTAFSDNATQCVALTSPEDGDARLVKWLEAEYDARR